MRIRNRIGVNVYCFIIVLFCVFNGIGKSASEYEIGVLAQIVAGEHYKTNCICTYKGNFYGHNPFYIYVEKNAYSRCYENQVKVVQGICFVDVDVSNAQRNYGTAKHAQ